MQVYSLDIQEFTSEDYSLIGVHSTLETYKLVFFINKILSLRMTRAKKDLCITRKNKNAAFAFYSFYNTKLEINWFLISNKYKDTIKSVDAGLFPQTESTTYLIPEKKKVDYFIKIEGDYLKEEIDKILIQINQIPQVIASYTIEPQKLKSKEFLIF